MNVEDILKLEADLIVRSPIKHRIKCGDEVVIKPLTVKQVMLIHPYLSIITADDLTEMQTMIETLSFAKIPELIGKYIEPISKIIEIAIKKDITNDADFEDFFKILVLVLSKMGNLYFQKSIILANKMSLEGQTEIIAVRKFLTSLN